MMSEPVRPPEGTARDILFGSNMPLTEVSGLGGHLELCLRSTPPREVRSATAILSVLLHAISRALLRRTVT